MRRAAGEPSRPARARWLAVAVSAALATAGCAVGSVAGPRPATPVTPPVSASVPTLHRSPPAVPPPDATTTPASAPAKSAPVTSPRPAPAPTRSRHPTTGHSSAPAPPPPTASPRPGAPVIVIDPGHSRSVSATDPATGLNVSDYENEPEMRDVFEVARLVARALRADGYRVITTKTSVYQRRNLAQRAATANATHADLALSIHDQAGPNGGIGFDDGNNIVYYQSVGTYRQNPAGRRIVFTDRHVAALSQKYAKIFAAERRRVHGVPIRVQGDVGYDLGSRGLAPGNIWTVQLLAHVPWIYNEAGGNSAGRSGLNVHDLRTYAAGLIAAVEKCLPIAADG